MSVIKEFREFAVKGNVMDLAVGVVIGAAFGKIVTSFVGDIIMPPLGLLIGGVNFTNLKLVLKEGIEAANGVAAKPPVTLNYGAFLQTLFDFLIVAVAIFALVKAINRLKRTKEEAPAAPAPPSKEVELLTQIRDALQKR
jgi:large conductance mechanosensitive channel